MTSSRYNAEPSLYDQLINLRIEYERLLLSDPKASQKLVNERYFGLKKILEYNETLEVSIAAPTGRIYWHPSNDNVYRQSWYMLISLLFKKGNSTSEEHTMKYMNRKLFKRFFTIDSLPLATNIRNASSAGDL